MLRASVLVTSQFHVPRMTSSHGRTETRPVRSRQQCWEVEVEIEVPGWGEVGVPVEMERDVARRLPSLHDDDNQPW